MKRLNDQFKYFMQNRSKKIMLKFVSHLNIIKSTNQIWDWHMQSNGNFFFISIHLQTNGELIFGFEFQWICPNMCESNLLKCSNRKNMQTIKSLGMSSTMGMALSKRIALQELYNHWIYSGFWLKDFKNVQYEHSDKKRVRIGTELMGLLELFRFLYTAKDQINHRAK